MFGLFRGLLKYFRLTMTNVFLDSIKNLLLIHFHFIIVKRYIWHISNSYFGILLLLKEIEIDSVLQFSVSLTC